MPDVRDFGDEYFRANYNTGLTPEEEMIYSSWLAKSSAARGRDISLDEFTYDVRGFAKSVGWKPLGKEAEHGPDTYKKPNHPTFSDESVYSGAKSPWGGVFTGGHWLADGSFIPTPTMLKTTHPKKWLEEYFRKYEKGVGLMFPKGY